MSLKCRDLTKLYIRAQSHIVTNFALTFSASNLVSHLHKQTQKNYNITYLAMSIPGPKGEPAAAAAAAAAARPRNRNMSWLDDKEFLFI